MTIEEKRQRIKANCINCMFCPLYDAIPFWEHCHRDGADIERNYEIMFGKGEQREQFEGYIQNCQGDPEGEQESEK